MKLIQLSRRAEEKIFQNCKMNKLFKYLKKIWN